MKRSHLSHTLTLVLALSNILALNGQEKTITLATNLSDSTREYVARDAISLLPGFMFAAQSGKHFNASIDPTLIFPPAANYLTANGEITTNPSQGSVVGSIPGQFAVSSTGAATYTTPIECPQGINGMQPNISLVYNSQGGNGIAGWGWNISGLSAIVRTKRMAYFDGVDDIVTWDSTSPLSLDGQRLIVINASSDSIEYRTYNETFNRIVGYSLQSWGPSYFKVYTKAGLTMTYGSPLSLASYAPLYDDAQTDALGENNYERAGWNLVEVCDNNGNFMTIEYGCSENSLIGNFVKRILYGANKRKGTSHNLVMTFNYEGRQDEIQAYVSGKEMLQQLRLSTIQIAVNNNIQKTYELDYSYQSVSRLIAVSSSINGNKEYNPIEFIYGGQESSLTNTDISHINKYADNSDKNIVGYTLLDIDGDGKNELCDINFVSTSLGYSYHVDYHYQNDGWTTHHSFPLSRTFIVDAGNILSGHEYKKIVDGLTAQFGDFNGDGTIESSYAFKEGSSIILQLWDRKNDVCIYDRTVGYSNNTPFIVSGNFYGKTTSDAVLIINDPESVSGSYRYKYNIIKGNNGAAPSTLPSVDPIYSPYYLSTPKKIASVSVCDFGSNQLRDDLLIKYEDNSMAVVRNTNTGSSCFSEATVIPLPYVVGKEDIFEVVDLNQDGFDDIVYRNQQTIHVGINKGNFTFQNKSLGINCSSVPNTPNTVFQDADEFENDNIVVCDFNNDGLNDVIVCDEIFSFEPFYIPQIGISGIVKTFNKTAYSFYKNNGGNFELAKTEESSKKANLSCFGDVVGNGSIGWVHYDEDVDKIVVTNLGYGLNKNALDSVKNPVSGYLKISYKTMADNGFLNGLHDFESPINTRSEYLNAGFHPFNTSHVSIVSETETGLGKTSYDYGTALNNWALHGFIGFKNLVVTNEVTGITTLTYNQILPAKKLLVPTRVETSTGFSVDNAYVPSLNKTVKMIYGNEVIGRVRNNYAVEELSNNRFSMQLVSSIKEDNLTGTTISESYNYDNYGNVTGVMTADEGGIDSHLIAYSYKPINFWCPNMVDSIKTVKTRENLEGYSEATRIVTKSYDTRGNLIAEETDPGDVNAVKTIYKNYNDFGLPETVEVISNGIARSTLIQYTSSGRHILNKTDPLGVTIENNWNETSGLLMSVTGVFGSTTYTYDHLNRLIETRTPNGLRSTEVTLWAGASDDVPGSKYYTYSETTGGPPVYTWYDAYGREIQRDSYGLNNRKVSVKTEYTPQGQVFRVSEPFFDVDSMEWASTYTYDDYGRIETVMTKHGLSSYSYWYNETTVTTPEGVSVTENNSLGELVYSCINGKAVHYDHNATGQVRAVYPDGPSSLDETHAILLEYDLQGNRTKITDPDAGVVESRYNGFGDLLWSKQAVHSSLDTVYTTFNYHPNGLTRSVVRRNVAASSTVDSIVYTYDPSNHYRLESVRLSGNNGQVFTYGDFDRVTQMVETIGEKTFTMQAEYDVLGRVKKYTYPSGFVVQNRFDENGYLTGIIDESGRYLWQALEENARGQLTCLKRGGNTATSSGLETTYTYDTRGFPQSIITPGIIGMAYTFDAKGNLESRQDHVGINQSEAFVYDGLNRLTNWHVTLEGASLNGSQSYDDQGNIVSRSDLENLTMGYALNGRPHAIGAINGHPTSIPMDSLSVAYTGFKKVSSISEGQNVYALTYGVDDQRRKSVYQANGVTQQTRYYVGDYEEEVDASGNVRKIHYLSGGAVLIRNNGVDSLLYAHTDYQGSLIALTNEAGTVLERYAYNPWGQRRNPANWTEADGRTRWILNRGYTGHEHLDAFRIINMNGRVYDPHTAQFFSPDPYISSPGDWLSYNRYAYCLNNPFKYTDPTGEIPALAVCALGFSTVFSMYEASMAFDAGGDFWTTFTQSFVQRAVTSLAFSAIPFGIGEAFGHGAGTFWHELARAGVHGLGGGAISHLQGGSFWQGFASGFVSSAVGSALQGSVDGSVLPFLTGAAGGLAGGVGLSKGHLNWSWDNAMIGVGIGYGVGRYNHDGPVYSAPPTDGQPKYGGELAEVVVTGSAPGGGALRGFWGKIQYDMPVWGSCVMTTDALKRGDYMNAGGHFMTAAIELFTLGASSGIIGSTRTATAATRSVVSGVKTSTTGGLNLFKSGAAQTSKSTGWNTGDYMLHLPNKGTPKLNWKANYGALRYEMNLGKPIFDSYRLPNGNLIPTGGFLNAERFTLKSRGWVYNPTMGAWIPPK